MASSPQTVHALFLSGVARAKAGDKAAAGAYFRQVVALEPHHEAAWLYLAGLAADAPAAAAALQQVQMHNSANPHLKKAWNWLAQTWPDYPLPNRNLSPSKSASSPQKSPPKFTLTPARLALAALVLAVSLLVTAAAFFQDAGANFIGSVMATPTHTPAEELARLQQKLEAATLAADQPLVIAALEEMRALAPDNPDITAQLAQSYYEQGLVFRNGGNFEEAGNAFGRGLEIDPSFEAIRREQGLITLYLTGVKHHQQAEWAKAVSVLEEVYSQSPAYPYIDEILYSAYFNLGLVKTHDGALAEALEAYRRAAQVLPSAPEAPRKVSEVALALNPPTPTPEPTPIPEPTSTASPTPPPPPTTQKRIVVDISDQRAYVYEGDTLVYNFLVSTGEPGRDTATGTFEILDKIPMAYASTWNLDMPYWLGVYWSGPLENGFHALPTVRDTGYTLWDGYLGQRVSYGCIILSYANAQTLYNWVDIGTPVTIRW